MSKFVSIWHFENQQAIGSEKLVIPALVLTGTNSSRACPALDAGNPGLPVETGSQSLLIQTQLIYCHWHPLRFRNKFGMTLLVLSC